MGDNEYPTPFRMQVPLDCGLKTSEMHGKQFETIME